MKSSHALSVPSPEAFRPSPAALRRVHGLRRHKGKIAAIEPRSGDYFVADDLLTAVRRGRQKHPGAVFYVVRVGREAAYVQHPSWTVGRRYGHPDAPIAPVRRVALLLHGRTVYTSAQEETDSANAPGTLQPRGNR